MGCGGPGGRNMDGMGCKGCNDHVVVEMMGTGDGGGNQVPEDE